MIHPALAGEERKQSWSSGIYIFHQEKEKVSEAKISLCLISFRSSDNFLSFIALCLMFDKSKTISLPLFDVDSSTLPFLVEEG